MDYVEAAGRSQVVQNTSIRFAPIASYAIKVSVRALDRSGGWPLAVAAVGGRTKVVHYTELAAGSQLEESAAIKLTPCKCGAVQSSVGSLHEPRRRVAVEAGQISGTEGVKRSQVAVESEFVDRTPTGATVRSGSTLSGHSVKIAIDSEDRRRIRLPAIEAMRSGAKIIERAESSGWSNFDDIPFRSW